MKLTRRDVLRFAGGSVVGVFFTPIPWKLLDDTSIWTQNWSLTPTLPRGPRTSSYTFCTLCPAGCSATARRVNGVPFGLSGIPAHPLHTGILCPAGFAAHHMPYHPLRFDGPRRFAGKELESPMIPVPLEEVVDRVKAVLASNAASGGTVAVLDQRPGRAISGAYQQFLSGFRSALYITPPSGADETLTALQVLAGGTLPPAGFDLANTQTLLSFGAPILDGWGSPGMVQARFGRGTDAPARLIQIESTGSRTAHAADLWLPVRPGTEAAVALSIANVIIREGLVTPAIERTFPDYAAYRELALQYHPHPVSTLAGVEADAIVRAARAIASGPSITLSGRETAGGPYPRTTALLIASLNLLTGNVGRPGGIVFRAAMPDAGNLPVKTLRLQDVPDHSVHVLIMDAAESGDVFPPALLERKLVPGTSCVVSLAPTITSRSGLADFLLPTAPAMECWEEVNGMPGAPVATVSVAQPLVAPRPGQVDPASFLRAIAGGAGAEDTRATIRGRVDAIAAARRGSVVNPADGSTTAVATMAGADELWDALVGGATWVDDAPAAGAGVRGTLLDGMTAKEITAAAHPAGGSAHALHFMPFGMRAAVAAGGVSPILSKLFQESDLRLSAGTVVLNPETAALLGVAENGLVKVRTPAGRMSARVKLDPTVMPGVVRAAVGPLPNRTPAQEEILDHGALALCIIREDGTWCSTEATIEKA